MNMYKKGYTKKYLANFTSLLLVLLLGLFLSGCSVSSDDIKKSQKLHEEGNSLIEEYRFGEAMEKFEGALRIYDGNEDVYESMAQIYILKHREKDAIDTIDVGISKASDISGLLRLRGEISLEKGDITDAIKDLKKSLDLKENSDVRYLLAISYVKNGDFEKARQLLDLKKFESGDIYAKAALLKAVIYKDRIDEAIAVLDTVISDEVSDDNLLSLVNEYQEILLNLTNMSSQELSDKYKDVILSGGALSVGIEDIAIDLLEKYKTTDELYWEIYVYLGQAYYLKGNMGEAKKYLDKSISLNPVSSLGYWILGRVYYENKNIDKSTESYMRAVELASAEDKREIRLEFAQVAIKQSKYTLADEQYQKLVQEDDVNESEYILKRGMIAYQRNRFADLATLLESINISGLTDNLLAQYYYLKAVVSLENNNVEDARKWIIDAIELDNRSAVYYLLYGRILFEEKDTQEAKLHFERAIDLDLEGEVSSQAMKFLDRL